MAKNVTNIRAIREQGVHCFDELTFIAEDTFAGLSWDAAGGPDPNARSVTAGGAYFVVRQEEVNQVATLAGGLIELL